MSDIKWIAIRVDASQEIGSGHVMRCLSLANELVKGGYRVYFICRDILPSLYEVLKNTGCNLKMLTQSKKRENKYKHSNWLSGTESDDAHLTVEVLSDMSRNYGQPFLVIVDHYALGAPWEEIIGEKSNILAIDDLSDRQHVADWLLDQTFGKSELDYMDLISEKTKLLIGTKYALLRNEFADKRDEAKIKRSASNNVQNILITLGGIDKNNITSLVLRALSRCKRNYNVTVIAGGGNLNFEKLELLTPKLNYPVTLYKERSDMAELMLATDLCIGAAGSMSWERCVLGLPTINIILAANQKTISSNLHKAGAAINFGVLDEMNLSALALAVDSIAKDNKKYHFMSEKAFGVCDGKGALITVERLIKDNG